MLVRDLIEKLKTYDGGLPVFVRDGGVKTADETSLKCACLSEVDRMSVTKVIPVIFDGGDIEHYRKGEFFVEDQFESQRTFKAPDKDVVVLSTKRG